MTDSHHQTWERWLLRTARPILTPMSEGKLRAVMPVEGKIPDRPEFTHLEAFGRLLAGIAPWLELGGERAGPLREQTLAALDHAVDPASPDFLNFTAGRQPVVDAAFLAEGLLRAPALLIDGLSAQTRSRVIDALRSTRHMLPSFNNWLLFSALVEAALLRLGADWDVMRVDYALRQHEQWYVGDGFYADGPEFHWDYYNSFVIQPMLVDLIRTVKDADPYGEWAGFEERILARASRHAAVQERLVSPEGTLPPIGRSLAYRFGSLHGLAQAAFLDFLPADLAPAQVRCAMQAVIQRMISAPGTFDGDGYLQIGYCGHQPAIGELYISTGSLYLCANAFLPLGLPTSHPFWAGDDQPWTQVRIYAGEDLPTDRALKR